MSRTDDPQVLRPAAPTGLRPDQISVPQRLAVPSTGGRTAWAWYYPPTNPDVAAPAGELPPLLVEVHGGPTGWADASFRLSRQFWTSRGFAIIDVDYAGSAGLGRDYRRLLWGTWGDADLDDVCAAAELCVARGLADPARLAVHGGSAGGFTVLSALSRRDTFTAGTSYFGVSDLTALARDTHKFESRYLDRLVGPLPAAAAIYHERSPLTHLDGFHRPLLVMQGLDDRVVPPSQARVIVDALAARGVPHAYLEFPGEGHGFRQPANQIRALEAELAFYGQVFGFAPHDAIPPVPLVGG
jgi:dipeptidyl aminopeptidase/acylaminoacyl peptidase